MRKGKERPQRPFDVSESQECTSSAEGISARRAVPSTSCMHIVYIEEQAIRDSLACSALDANTKETHRAAVQCSAVQCSKGFTA